ncbi:MAG: efflux transporter outer membrane subunit [Woeseiaceae bacterium]|nr:efflux transporter outer membrane subunit [Woeseiaceae bacterium]NIP21862.1 efflux transporter outer membrane subunit [Woeseiaceae bacterium]NIS90947.1 efflux transporter outer membrane subunit [Woeseiaceae bacterium]
MLHRKRHKQAAVTAARSIQVLALLACGACTTVGPDFEQPEVRLNPAWLDAELELYATEPAELVDWWRHFDDPVLDSLIAASYENSYTLEIAALRIQESSAQLAIASGNRWPQTQVATAGATVVGTGDDNAADSSIVQYDFGAALAWELDFWGKYRRAIEAADAGFFASVADFNDVVILLTAQVADTYFVIRSIEEQLELAEESVKIQQRSFEIADVLFRNGENSELDALQARTLLLSTQAVIPGLELSLKQAKIALGAILGVTSAEVEQFFGTAGKLPDVPDRLAVGMPADLLRQRPDVRAAEMRARAQNALVGVATANLYPSFSLNGTLGFASDDTAGSPGLFDSDSLGYSAGLSMVWPFLNYGRIKNSIRVEDVRLQQALAAYQNTVLQAAAEVESAMAAYSGTRDQDRVLSEGVAAAVRSAELSLLRYQEGFADYQRVLDSQQALFGQQQRYAANRGNVVRSLVAIYRSLGGGWQTQ